MDLYIVLIGLLLVVSVVLVQRRRPSYRIEVPANRFVRWCITYILPIPPALLAVIVVVVWLPQLLSINTFDPTAARIVSIGVFIPMYLWQVSSYRKLIRKQDSRSSDEKTKDLITGAP